VVEGASKVPIATSLKNALKQANYLIVTHPGLLYMQYWMNEVDELLSSMAHLAKLKRGALGFLTKYDASTLRNLIKPGGAWASKLHSQFSSVTLGGYVLIVGESEVVPAYGVSLGTSLIHASDHPYSDVVGDDNRPDLVVARIVGDSAAKLAKPLQTSVSITEGKAGFGFDRSHALSVGGGGGGVNTWTQDAIGAANLLDDEYSVTTLLCTHYFELSSFQSSFASGARLTVGDVTGDAKAEIVVGDPHADQIHVYDGGGTKVKSFDCGYGAKQFEAGDRLAVANHVIYMADVSADQVLKYNWAGVLQSHFNVSLEAADGLAAGDVAGDGYEDIVVADASADKIRVFTHNWVKQSEFSRSYDVSHELAVGNALGLSKAQIVIASGSSGKVEVWTSAGSKETSFNAFFSSNDLLAVGDTFGKGRADVLRYDDAFGRVHIYRYGVPENKTVGSFVWDRYFDTWCTGSVGLAAGGVEGNNKDQIVVGIPTSGKVHIYESGCGDRLTTPFESKAKEQDLVFFSDHGSSTTWGSALRMSDFPVAFGGANPLLFGAACSTADYEGFDDNTISEGFFDSGAAAYIGATVNSDAGLDTPAKDVFFKNWVNQSTSVGRAFAATERDFQQKYKDDYWVLEYNLYGDPKLGLTAGALSSQDASTGRGQPPPPLLDLAVPDYEVTRVAGWDHVHIPSGGTMLEEGKPLVPIYSVQLDFPKGHQVQDVLLLELGDWATTTGLHIPNREVVIKRGVTEDSHLAQAESAAAGWYPDRQYDWSVLQNLGGSTAVQITVYPFDYNPLTTDARLRKRYRFEIVYVGTDVEIIGLETDRDAYEPGETVVVDVALHAGEMPGDALIRLTVKRQGSQELVGGLLLRTLRDLQGEATYSAQWDASGEEPGGYFVEATVHAADGTVLAERTAPFQLGIAAGEVARFEASPAVFQVGDDVSLFLAFSNVGTQAIVSGTARIGVYDALGAAVQRFDHKFTGLAAGQSVQVDRTWDTAGAAPGSYRIRAYVLFDSQATEPMTAVVRSGRFVALPIVRKAYW